MTIWLALHIALALLSVTGFVMRATWAYVAPDLLQEKWVRIAPHIIDTLLLLLGVTVAMQMGIGLTEPWLVTKLLVLVCYIGFGVLTLRGRGMMRVVGLVGALLSACALLVIAFSRAAF